MRTRLRWTLAALALSCLGGTAYAQSRLPAMPGYSRWAEVAPQIPSSIVSGAITPSWAADGKSFTYAHDGREWRYDVRQKRATLIRDVRSVAAEPSGPLSSPAERPLVFARGRGADADVTSPDGKRRAFSRNMNMWVSDADGRNETQLSFDGGEAARIRNGVGSYIYLEEFSVRSPVWWSPDGRKVAWMRYDESSVDDYKLQLDLTKMFSSVLVQAFPHPGRMNPVADLMVHDFSDGSTRRMDVREGSPFIDQVVGHYVWAAQWSQDSSQILVRRADRLQKIYDLAACDPASGACRSVARESRPETWASGDAPRFLSDGKRFIWTSEANGWRNLYLGGLDGRELTPLTRHSAEVVDVVRIDEAADWIWYTARTGDNPLKIQLHRVRFDGSGDQRLTDPSMTHRVSISPDGRHFVDVAQAHNRPPVSRLLNDSGRVISEIASSGLTEYSALGLQPPEMFEYLSADGLTPLKGTIEFPSGFDPARTYPVLFSVYGGPSSADVTEAFSTPAGLAEFGFLIVRLEARSSAGKGRAALDQMYKSLGVAEIDDFAAGLKALKRRPYVDGRRMGVFGTSYGGTVAAMMMLRYPHLVQAAVSNSPVADFRLYDTAYTERYLGLPGPDAAAYDRAALLPLADRLRGDLMIYYGTSDDNVHPNNAMQLIRALQASGKSFDVQVGPDKGHTSVNQLRMMEFFIDRLVLNDPPGAQPLEEEQAQP